MLRKQPLPTLRTERLELDDGDFIDVDWLDGHRNPLVLILHGLEGSRNSHYARRLLTALQHAGIPAVLMHFRGCSGHQNRLPRSYHSGDTDDLRQVLELIKQRQPDVPVCAVGYSLGANALLKYLGENGADTLLQRAVAVSAPMSLAAAADRLNRGFSRFYQWHLLRSLKHKYQQKFSADNGPVAISNVRRLNSFRLFDDQVTAPLHGFSGVDDYYHRSSARQYLRDIQIPTLILHASDDPFMTGAAIPVATELSSTVELELSERGGHVGFIASHGIFGLSFWLENRILQHLQRIGDTDEL